MRRWFRSIAALFITAQVTILAAIGGVPESPVPGRAWPHAWILIHNDDFGIDDYAEPARAQDDHRTGAILTGLRLDRWLLYCDYSILTDRYQERRSDELTISFGRLLTDDSCQVAGGSLQTAVGLGLRTVGDLGGDHIQEAIHETIDIYSVSAAYEDEAQTGLLWGSAEWYRLSTAQAAWRGGAAVSLRTSITGRGEAKHSLAAHGLVQHRWIDGWLGLRLEGRQGRAINATKDLVRDVEDGLWLSYGVAVHGRFVLSGGYNTGSDESYGTFGVVWPAYQP